VVVQGTGSGFAAEASGLQGHCATAGGAVQVCTTAAASNNVRRHVIIFASNLNKQSCSECGLAYCFFSSGGSYAVDMKKVDAQNLSDWVMRKEQSSTRCLCADVYQNDALMGQQ
jgi:hypothetical protein